MLKNLKVFEETIERQTEPIIKTRGGYHEVIRLLTQIRLSEDAEYEKLIDELRDLLDLNYQARMEK